MRLADDVARERLAGHDHGILCTLHPARGVDAVPVVYVVGGAGRLAVPIDAVKAKSTPDLQRARNLVADPRATLLVERWDRDDWSQLWWVRAELRHRGDDEDDDDGLATRLAERFVQYRDRPFHRLLVFDVIAVTGWAAS